MILRPARLADAYFLLRVRNDPETRRQSLSTGAVSADRHREWLESVLLSTRRLLFVGEAEGQPIGYVRLDLNAGTSEAEVSVALAPEARGRGLGGKIIAAAVAEGRERGIVSFMARVRPDNLASLSAFEGAGFAVTLVELIRSEG